MSPRTTLKVFGPKRAHVRVFREGDLVRVQWREHGRLITKSWAATATGKAEALAFAKGFALSRVEHAAPAARLTLRELWTRYAEAEFPSLRVRSQQLYAAAWRRFELFAGRDTIADDVALDTAARYRRDLERVGLAVSTTHRSITVVKVVFAWGERHELVTRNRFRLYRFKVAKDKRPLPVPEYRAADFAKIIAQFNPKFSSQWKPFVALTLCARQGARQNAVLHLQWSDLAGWEEESPPGEARVTWRGVWSKTGEEWTQPLRADAIAAVRVAASWRAENGDGGPWVFPSGSSLSKRDTYSIQSLWQALQRAEKAAGITKVRQRGGHSLRRMLAGDVTVETGNPMLGLQAIGDRDPRQAARYIQRRDDQLRQAFTSLDEKLAAVKDTEEGT